MQLLLHKFWPIRKLSWASTHWLSHTALMFIFHFLKSLILVEKRRVTGLIWILHFSAWIIRSLSSISPSQCLLPLLHLFPSFNFFFKILFFVPVQFLVVRHLWRCFAQSKWEEDLVRECRIRGTLPAIHKFKYEKNSLLLLISFLSRVSLFFTQIFIKVCRALALAPSELPTVFAWLLMYQIVHVAFSAA